MTQRIVVIEVPRGGFVKRKDDGAIDFVSPLPCPFNYGSVPGTKSDDGDPLDAVVLGPRFARDAVLERTELGVVDFVDAGDSDPKLICGLDEMTPREQASVAAFFRIYALAKRALNRARRKEGPTAFRGLRVHHTAQGPDA